jgi:hypothetical protein
MTITCATVNKKLRPHGVKIYKGRGYYYFMTDSALVIPSLYINDLSCTSTENIVEYVEDCIHDSNANK